MSDGLFSRDHTVTTVSYIEYGVHGEALGTFPRTVGESPSRIPHESPCPWSCCDVVQQESQDRQPQRQEESQRQS